MERLELFPFFYPSILRRRVKAFFVILRDDFPWGLFETDLSVYDACDYNTAYVIQERYQIFLFNLEQSDMHFELIKSRFFKNGEMIFWSKLFLPNFYRIVVTLFA